MCGVPVWISLLHLPHSSGKTRAYPKLEPFLGYKLADELIISVGLLGARLRYPLSVWFPVDAPLQYSPINESLASLVENKTSEVRRPWYGTAVVLKYSGTRRSRYVNMTEYDLGGLASYYMDHQDI